MNITMILEMAASAAPRRRVVTGAPALARVDEQSGRSLTAADLQGLAQGAASRFASYPAVLYLGANHLAYPVALFGAAMAKVPFVPLNYRLSAEALGRLVDKHPGALVLRAEDLDGFLEQAAAGARAVEAGTAPEPEPATAADGDKVAAIIYTSGTTAEPKAALLRHRHLLAYIFNTLDFASAGEPDAALVAVPPYHIAGMTNLLSNLYTGRRIVYLPAFTPQGWLDTVRGEGVTHAMLVPTMLARIVSDLAGAPAEVPSLRTLAYGGARTPRPVLERALAAFADVGFVNAYGLTETASSICVLAPEDHRDAAAAPEGELRERLGSVGRPLPGVEIAIRDEDGRPVPDGGSGLVFVRGEQISGEYGGRSSLDAEGWFPTRDLGHLDSGGYLFIEGRSDDTIIRGGENIAPAEIEDVLLEHPSVAEVAVLGMPDPEWGQRIVAVVVGEGEPEELRTWVRERLRSSKTPDAVVFRPELPKTETGKLVRRDLIADLATELESNHA